jgi:hypothetical protein
MLLTWRQKSTVVWPNSYQSVKRRPASAHWLLQLPLLAVITRFKHGFGVGAEVELAGSVGASVSAAVVAGAAVVLVVVVAAEAVVEDTVEGTYFSAATKKALSACARKDRCAPDHLTAGDDNVGVQDKGIAIEDVHARVGGLRACRIAWDEGKHER